MQASASQALPSHSTQHTALVITSLHIMPRYGNTAFRFAFPMQRWQFGVSGFFGFLTSWRSLKDST